MAILTKDYLNHCWMDNGFYKIYNVIRPKISVTATLGFDLTHTLAIEPQRPHCLKKTKRNET